MQIQFSNKFVNNSSKLYDLYINNTVKVYDIYYINIIQFNVFIIVCCHIDTIVELFVLPGYHDYLSVRIVYIYIYIYLYKYYFEDNIYIC